MLARLALLCACARLAPAAAAGTPLAPDVPFFFISLLSSPSGRWRAARVQRHFANVTSTLRHVPAVDGNRSARSYVHTDHQLNKLVKRNTLSEIGCSMSHVNAIARAERHCAAVGCPMAVIMEDDVTAELTRFWTARALHTLAASLPENWAVVQLQLIAQKREWDELIESWRAQPSVLAVPHDRRRHFGTGAYLIHQRGMRQILQAFTAPPVPRLAARLHATVGGNPPLGPRPAAGSLTVPLEMDEVQADLHLVYSIAQPVFLATPTMLSCSHSATSIAHHSAARMAEKGAAEENELAHKVSIRPRRSI